MISIEPFLQITQPHADSTELLRMVIGQFKEMEIHRMKNLGGKQFTGKQAHKNLVRKTSHCSKTYSLILNLFLIIIIKSDIQLLKWRIGDQVKN